MGATDTTTCPCKTRWTDNTGSSVLLRDDLGFTRDRALNRTRNLTQEAALQVKP